MLPDERDTIVAIATPAGPAPRGVVRVSGPQALAVVGAAARPADAQRVHQVRRAAVVEAARIAIELAGRPMGIDADLYVWPGERSYTRQASVEIHAPASDPVLNAIQQALCRHGARLAAPGEFTLRAVLSGRIDLTQAEAVLGVIDARHDADLQVSLQQLAGGLAGPLAQVKDELVTLLADLEAGLDFVEEEDVRFLSPSEATRRLTHAAELISQVEHQATSRATADGAPAVALVGPPNAGKSTLFNALVAVASDARGQRAPALVSDTAGSTRDRLAAVLRWGGQVFELVDTAGEDAAHDPLSHEVQKMRKDAVGAAAVQVHCRPPGGRPAPDAVGGASVIKVGTMGDLPPRGAADQQEIAVSAVRQQGLELLLDAITAALDAHAPRGGAMVATTATRCREALADARECLTRASPLMDAGQEELVSLEVRAALASLGRVTGDVTSDEVLGRIFSQFCIGK